jgi:Sigma-70 region 2
VGESDWLAQRFEENRTRLRAVAYQMLGSLSDADDAVQEAWLAPGISREIRGARAVAEGALTFSRLAGSARPALVNGAAGIVAFDPRGRPFSVMGFTVTRGKIAEIDVLADPARLRQLDLALLHDRKHDQ